MTEVCLCAEDNRRELRRLGALKRVLHLLPLTAQDTTDHSVARFALLAVTSFCASGAWASSGLLLFFRVFVAALMFSRY
jgi:hypothetical protein